MESCPILLATPPNEALSLPTLYRKHLLILLLTTPSTSKNRPTTPLTRGLGGTPATLLDGTPVRLRGLTQSIVLTSVAPLLFLAACSEPPVREARVEEPIEVPFEFVNGQIIVEVQLSDGESAQMNIDTGVFPSMVDTSVARQLGLRQSRGVGQISGAGGNVLSYHNATLPSVALGDFVVEALPVIVMATSHLVVARGYTLEGSLGDSFFRKATVEIDFPEKVLRFWTLDVAADSAAVSLDLDVSGATPSFRLKVNGVPTAGLLDTGGSGGLMLSDSAARTLNLGPALERARVVGVMGARGAFQARRIQVDSVTIAGMTVYNVSAVVMPSGPTWVGNDVWKAFRLRLDYDSQQISLVQPQSN